MTLAFDSIGDTLASAAVEGLPWPEGDADGLADASRTLTGAVDLVRTNAGRVEATHGLVSGWQGDAAGAFASALTRESRMMQNSAGELATAAAALQRLSQVVEEAQQRVDRARRGGARGRGGGKPGRRPLGDRRRRRDRHLGRGADRPERLRAAGAPRRRRRGGGQRPKQGAAAARAHADGGAGSQHPARPGPLRRGARPPIARPPPRSRRPPTWLRWAGPGGRSPPRPRRATATPRSPTSPATSGGMLAYMRAGIDPSELAPEGRPARQRRHRPGGLRLLREPLDRPPRAPVGRDGEPGRADVLRRLAGHVRGPQRQRPGRPPGLTSGG